jgi:hypothetical protein
MKPRTAAGLGLMFASFALFGGGGVLIAKAIDQDERATRQREAADQQCRTLIAGVGTVSELPGGALEVKVPGVPDPRKALSDVTASLVMCPERTLTKVCVGDGCEGGQPGQVALSFTLQKSSL